MNWICNRKRKIFLPLRINILFNHTSLELLQNKPRLNIIKKDGTYTFREMLHATLKDNYLLAHLNDAVWIASIYITNGEVDTALDVNP